MKVRGYRVVPLTYERNILDEIGEKHYFTTSLERARWWAKVLPNEDPNLVPQGMEIAMYGFAIVAVEAEGTQQDTLSGSEEDFRGLVISATVVEVTIHRKPPRKPWWRCLLKK